MESNVNKSIRVPNITLWRIQSFSLPVRRAWSSSLALTCGYVFTAAVLAHARGHGELAALLACGNGSRGGEAVGGIEG